MTSCTPVAILTLALGAGLLSGCPTSSAPVTTEPRLPAAQNLDVRIQPARIPPNLQGAFALSSATGCDVIFVARAATSDTVTYALRPTSRVPDPSECLDLLKQQPGVEAVALAR